MAAGVSRNRVLMRIFNVSSLPVPLPAASDTESMITCLIVELERTAERGARGHTLARERARRRQRGCVGGERVRARLVDVSVPRGHRVRLADRTASDLQATSATCRQAAWRLAIDRPAIVQSWAKRDADATARREPDVVAGVRLRLLVLNARRQPGGIAGIVRCGRLGRGAHVADRRESRRDGRRLAARGDSGCRSVRGG